METEIEAKFPDIDCDALRQKLKDIGATMVHPEILMRRKNFDYPDWRLEKIGGWIRVRNEGDKTTMSYKELSDRTLHGTKEISLIVEDFEKACEFLASIGLQIKSYQETKREKWIHDGVEITIDTWPWVPPFVELEGPTEENVKGAAKVLCLDWKNALYGSVEVIYQTHYDFTDSEIDHWESITFSSPPEWLLAKKKK
ncbi:MAG: class IV adenylate cyclase [Candidatus Paceibacterota bacterium]|jgi:adenylate cyclase class 2